MNQTVKTLLIIGLLFFAGKKLFDQAYNRIIYGTTKLRTRGFQLGQNSVGLKVQVIQPITNENPVSFPLDDFRGVMYYGQRPLAQFAMPGPTNIAAGSTVDLVFDGVLDFEESLETLQHIIQTGNWIQALRFQGTATSGGVTFPFNHTVRVG